jgi:hypothetical protein
MAYERDGEIVKRVGLGITGIAAAASKYTPELHAKFVELANDGLPHKIICPLVGISKWTFDDWRDRGHAGEEPYASFIRDVDAARAADAQRMIAIAKSQIVEKGDPKYALRYISVMHDIQEKVQTKKVETTTNVNVGQQFNLDLLTESEFQAWCLLVDKMKPGKVSEPEIQGPKLIDGTCLKVPEKF